jgi:DNA polymerase
VWAFLTFAKAFNVNLSVMADSVWDELPGKVKRDARAFYSRCIEDKKTHDLDEKTFVACDSIKRLWREANPSISSYWGELEHAARLVLNSKNDGEIIIRDCKIDRKGTWLRIRLPSGRYMCYAGASIEDDKIKYLGVNQYTRKWCRLSTYGGKLCENICQAASRDILYYGMQLAEDRGYPVILSVHDELLTETPDSNEYSVAELCEIMSTNPPWAAGLPLAAAGFEGYRYRKD